MRTLEVNEKISMITTLKIKQFSFPDKTKLTAAIYARKSSEDKNATAIETQISDCRSFINNNSELMQLNENYVFIDKAKSGMFQDNRDGFLQMMSEARKGNIDVIVLYHHERLTRKVGDFDNIKQELEKLNVFLVFGDVYYENTNMGEFFSNISFATSQYEARTAASKTANTLHLKAQHGTSAGGRAPYGLKCIAKQFDINETEAPAVKLMFEYTAKNYTYRQIIDELTSLGYLTRAGAPFSPSTISDMLRNWKYAGVYVYCKKDKNGKPARRKTHRVLLGEQEEVRNNDTVIRPIVSKSLFLKVQKILDERELGNAKQNAHSEYLLSGLVKCECGRNMYGEKVKSQRGKNEYRYYTCDNSRRKTGCTVKKIRADELETAVKKFIFRELKAFLKANKASSTALTKIENDYSASLGRVSRKIQETERQNKQLARKLTNATTDLSATLQATIEENAELLRAMQAKSESLQKVVKTLQSLKAGEIVLSEEQLFADTSLARRLIRAFVKEIIIKNDNVEIQLHN